MSQQPFMKMLLFFSFFVALTTVMMSAHAVPSAPLTLEQKLSQRAQQLFDAGMLLAPAEDNAYIRYRALQILYPESTAAKSGLDAILIHEIADARNDLQKSRLTAANRKMTELQKLFPGSPLLASLQKDITQARKALRQRQARVRKEHVVADDRVYLDSDALKQKNDKIVDDLTQIAKQIRASNESIYIYARTDAEARWIYKTMRDAVKGYRIRGDIRIGKPAIRRLPPL